MTPTTPTIAVVGASLAGASAATAARDAGFDGRIVLIGDEPGLPYERPPLSKAILRDEAPLESADLHDAAHYAERQIELIAGRTVTSLDLVDRAVVLDGDERIECTTTVIATGSAPRRLAVPGADLDGVHHLRTRVDSRRLRDALHPGVRVGVIGAGWIGTEVAASARQVGAEVVLIDPGAVPLQKVLGERIGGVFAALHADHGVTLRLGTGVRSLAGNGTVERVVLSDGTTEAVDLVVAGIGATPRTGLAERAGLTVDNGIVVDRHLQTPTSGLYAAGDVASAYHPHLGQHLRVEHWANALNQGATAGANAAGAEQSYDRLPYFFTDQYDLGMEYVGFGEPDDEQTVRGDLDSRQFIAFWHRRGVITAAMTVNTWDVIDDLRALILERAVVDLDRLADDDVPLGGVTA